MSQFKVGDFSALPKIDIATRARLCGAQSQYIPEKNKIYLASDFVEAIAEEALVSVLLQETINAIRVLISQGLISQGLISQSSIAQDSIAQDSIAQDSIAQDSIAQTTPDSK